MSPSRLGDALAALGWTQAEAGKRLGISGRMVRHYLTARTEIRPAHAEIVEAAMAEVEAMDPIRLRAALRALGLTRELAAQQLGVTHSELAAMLRGERTVSAGVRQAVRAMF